MREGRGNCLKYFKREWNRIEGRGNKDFKKEGQAGSRRGCLKKKGGWNPITNYGLCDANLAFRDYNEQLYSSGLQKALLTHIFCSCCKYTKCFGKHSHYLLQYLLPLSFCHTNQFYYYHLKSEK